MTKVYAISLVLGVIGLVVFIFGGALAESLRRPRMDPGSRLGPVGKSVVGGLVGFGMGGMSAELSPLDLSPLAVLALAVLAAGLSVYWVRYAIRSQAGP